MFKKIKLDNGITVVMERMQSFRSVALGFWVNTGSRFEPAEKNGISHFLEHMFFKGTPRRTAQDIAVEIDNLGGELNAYTSKEGTTLYVKVLDDFLAPGLELLSDIYSNSTFPEEEIEREISVVKEEIRMVEDTPDDYIHDLFSRTIWGRDGLGQPVLGTDTTVGSFERADLLRHVGHQYGVENTVVSCAGNFEEDRLVRLLNETIGKLGRKGAPATLVTPAFTPTHEAFEKDLSEAHVCLAVPGIQQASPDRYAALLINIVLGGGISSRLFQEIREKRGLVYSVYSFLSSHLDTGLWAVYAGVSKENLSQVIEMCAKEMKGLASSMTEEEFERAKTQLKGNIVLGLESTSRRMQNIANQEIYYGRYFSPEEIIGNVERVTLREARDLCHSLVQDGSRMALTVLGPLKKNELPAL